MKKNVSLLFAIICFVNINSFAQENKSKEVELKVYYNYDKTNYHETFYINDSEVNWIKPELISHRLGDLSIGLIFIRSNKVSHELELMPISINKSRNIKEISALEVYFPETPDCFSTFKSRFRYQYNYTFLEKSTLDFYIGLSSMLSYFLFDYKPSNSFKLPQNFSQFGLTLGITPGFKFPIAENLNFSFDIPVGIIGMNYKNMKTENPILIGDQLQNSSLSGEFWYQGFQVRVGLGYRF